MRRAKARTQKRERLRRALVLVGSVLIVLAAAASASLAQADVPSAARSYVERMWACLSDGGGFETAIEEVGLHRLGEGGMPEWIGELCAPSMLGEAYANEDASIIGFSRSGEAGDAEDLLRRELTARGWQEQGGGQEGLASYVKEEGVCRWVMVKASKVGDAVSVVLHIRRT